ncbi:hypothetical protein F5876DRAFT_63655 [Lentinula aff. lateritia]|uniref:Uncharacterized protein n=1 Tax=Lentinula aff. lateritia TaxID=2804960 RepID=A0ACC1U7W6_9AGAR|nr:hypothetical protein F5876DRAFT_63655 [Lentinula aff. lateritia]
MVGLAMLLKHKGFDPAIYERHTGIQNAGLILGVSPQTLKVLNILRLAEGIISIAVGRGIPVYFGKKLVDVNQNGDRVSAVFEDGMITEGDLVVGCDGLHSAVRNTLFGKEDPQYMGLVQIGGFSPIPDSLRNEKPTEYQIYGDRAHFISMPINDKEMRLEKIGGDRVRKKPVR